LSAGLVVGVLLCAHLVPTPCPCRA